MTVLELVAFDIETTGFAVDDEVTVVGFAVPMGARVFCQRAEHGPGDIDGAVDDVVGGETIVNVSTHPSEHALLVSVSEFITDRFSDSDVLLTAYNGDRWNGGFDLPFLRTRVAHLDEPWPFVDVPYADVMPVITDRFNTTIDGDEHGDLVTVYDTLCDGKYSDLDPFDESSEAVTAFEEGHVRELILHNVADVLRTRALGHLAERYCGKSEFNVKSLTPTKEV